MPHSDAGRPGAAGEEPGRGDLAGDGSAPALEDLLRRASRGEEQAFAGLYDATAARVHGLVLRVVRDPAVAQEVTQEAFVEVWRQSARFTPGQGSALGWMLTIAHRRAVDRVRSVEAARRRDEAWHSGTHETEHDVTAEQATSSLEARRVRAAMDQLTETQREAVRLAFFGGYSHREVATMLGLPLGTAKTRIRDGLIRLRDIWGVTA